MTSKPEIKPPNGKCPHTKECLRPESTAQQIADCCYKCGFIAAQSGKRKGAPQDGWISTRTQKPPFNTPVLVNCSIYGRYIGIFEQLDNSREGIWIDFEGIKGALPPTHWMPLPQPPKEEK